MKQWLSILIVVCVVLAASSVKAEDRPSLPKKRDNPTSDKLTDFINKTLYHDFLLTKVLAKQHIQVWFIGGDEEKIGLTKNKLTDYLRLRVKNNFANMKFEDKPWKKYTPKEIGMIVFKVWVVGIEYPVVYHIRGEFWSGVYLALDSDEDHRIWETEMLGFGSEATVPDTIKNNIGDMIEQLAITFYKVRGEL